ncbi:hypothetical protein X975_05473, partial [Stegodyphus mimosarum]
MKSVGLMDRAKLNGERQDGSRTEKMERENGNTSGTW